MPGLTLRAQHSPQEWLRRSFTCVVAAVATAFEVFAEAEDRSSAARARFPSAD